MRSRQRIWYEQPWCGVKCAFFLNDCNWSGNSVWIVLCVVCGALRCVWNSHKQWKEECEPGEVTKKHLTFLWCGFFLSGWKSTCKGNGISPVLQAKSFAQRRFVSPWRRHCWVSKVMILFVLTVVLSEYKILVKEAGTHPYKCVATPIGLTPVNQNPANHNRKQHVIWVQPITARLTPSAMFSSCGFWLDNSLERWPLIFSG